MSEADSIRPSPRRGMNGSSEALGRAEPMRLGAAALVALGVAQVVVEGRRAEQLALLGRRRLEQQLVHLGQRLGHRLALLRALDQRGELEQLEVADDRVRDVEVGVEPHLAQARRPRARRVSSSSSRIIRKVEWRPSAGPKSSSSCTSSSPRARRAPPRRAATGRGARAARSPSAQGARAPRRARVIARCTSRRISRLVLRRVAAGRRSLSSASGTRRPARAPGRASRAARQPEHEHVVELARPWRRRIDITRTALGEPPAARPPPRAARPRRPRRRSARSRAGSALGLAAHVGGGELGELGDVHEPLDRVGLGREDLLAAQPDPLDQPVHEAVGAHLLERARGRAGGAQEGERAVAALGRELRAPRAPPRRRRPCRACAGARAA